MSSDQQLPLNPFHNTEATRKHTKESGVIQFLNKYFHVKSGYEELRDKGSDKIVPTCNTIPADLKKKIKIKIQKEDKLNDGATWRKCARNKRCYTAEIVGEDRTRAGQNTTAEHLNIRS